MNSALGGLHRRLRWPALSVSSALISRSCFYVVLVLLARMLTPTDFGAFSLLTVLVGVIAALASGGGDMWLNRFTWHSASKSGRAPRVWRVYLLACVSSASVTLAISLAGAAVQGNEYMAAAMLAFVAGTVLGLAEALLAILRASNMVRSFFLLRDIIGPLSHVGAILLVRPQSLETAFVIQLCLNTALLLFAGFIILINAGTLLPVVPSRRGTARWVLRHTLGLVVGNLSSRLAMYADILVLGFFVSLADVGEYRVAAQAAIGFTIVQHFFFLGLPWQIRHLGVSWSKGLGYAGVLERQRLLLLFSLVGLVVLWVLTDTVLSILGDRFLSVAFTFRMLLALRFVELLWGPQHEILISKGRLGADVISNVLSMAGWLVAFALLPQSLPVQNSAVLANVAASAVRHLYRNGVLARLGLACPVGHPAGALLPLAAYGVLCFLLVQGG